MVKEIVEPYSKGASFRFGDKVLKSSDVADIQIRETSIEVSPILYTFESGTDVTGRFISKLRKEEKPTPKRVVVGSKNVFIVHGRDHTPLKELKSMLTEFGLNPIVLHEKASGSRTIIEKLEKYSEVGYAFVILTPDDIGGPFKGKVPILGGNILENSHFRARQNVVLEFGYFMGLLGRDSVCCLYKGDIELPSDMHGIVYIHFEKSVSEVKDKIIEELKEAGYEIECEKGGKVIEKEE